MQMSGLELRAVVAELQGFAGSRVQRLRKIRDLVYQLELGNSWLLIDLSFGCFLSPLWEWQEDNFCKSFTGLMKGKRIESIGQVGLDRIIRINCGVWEIVLELFGGGNILVLEDGIIRRVLKPKEWKARKLFPGEKYLLPPVVEMPKTKEEFEKIPAIQLVGKKYASELVGEDAWSRFLILLEKASQGTGSPEAGFNILGDKPFSRVVGEYYKKEAMEDLGRIKSKNIEKLSATIEKQKELIKEYKNESNLLRTKGKYIYDNLEFFEYILDILKHGGVLPEEVSIKSRVRDMITIEMK